MASDMRQFVRQELEEMKREVATLKMQPNEYITDVNVILMALKGYMYNLVRDIIVDNDNQIAELINKANMVPENAFELIKEATKKSLENKHTQEALDKLEYLTDYLDTYIKRRNAPKIVKDKDGD